jgi:hypothetical protein
MFVQNKASVQMQPWKGFTSSPVMNKQRTAPEKMSGESGDARGGGGREGEDGEQEDGGKRGKSRYEISYDSIPLSLNELITMKYIHD